MLNELGHGLLEKPHERALLPGPGRRAIPHCQQPRHIVTYMGREAGEFVPDPVDLDRVAVETKVAERATDHDMGQVPSWLRITGLQLVELLNSGYPRLEWRRGLP